VVDELTQVLCPGLNLLFIHILSVQLLPSDVEVRNHSVSSQITDPEEEEKGEEEEEEMIEAASSITVDDEEVYGDGAPVGVLTMVIVRSR
jgi:hypothetical protein